MHGHRVHAHNVSFVKSLRVDPLHGRELPDGIQLARALKRQFRLQRADILRGLSRYAPQAKSYVTKDITILPPDNWYENPTLGWDYQLSEAVFPSLELYWDQGGDRKAAELASVANRLGYTPTPWSIQPHGIQQAIRDAAFTLSREVNHTTKKRMAEIVPKIKSEIEQGLLRGDAYREITKRVNGVFAEADERRSYAIAATEATRAIHLGEIDAAEQSGVVIGKEWLISADACPLCQTIKMDNEARLVGLREAFAIVGDHPDYSFVDAPPAHPTCRCSLIEVLIGDERGRRRGVAPEYKSPPKEPDRQVRLPPPKPKTEVKPKPEKIEKPKKPPEPVVPIQREKPIPQGEKIPTRTQKFVTEIEENRNAINQAASYEEKLRAFTRGDRIVKDLVRLDKQNDAVRSQFADYDHAKWSIETSQNSLNYYQRELDNRDFRVNSEKELKKFVREQKKKIKEHAATIAKHEAEVAKLKASILDVIGVPKDQQTAITLNLRDRYSEAQQTEMRAATDGITELLTKRKWDVTAKTTEDNRLQFSVYYPTHYGSDRAYHRPGELFIPDNAAKTVVAHEIGHELEDVRNVKNLTTTFVNKRTAGQTPIKMSDAVHSSKYEDHEVSKGDDGWRKLFEGVGYGRHEAITKSFYLGRLYSSGHTEVISLGVELMLKDPVRFAKIDPEYFKLVNGVLSGVF